MNYGGRKVCATCKHPFSSHQPHASMGDECVYNVYGHKCGCRVDNPDRVAEDRLAAELWRRETGATRDE